MGFFGEEGGDVLFSCVGFCEERTAGNGTCLAHSFGLLEYLYIAVMICENIL